MYRFLLYAILLFLFVRAISRLWNGFLTGINGGPAASPGESRVPQRGVQMVRDPICGTFVVPGQSITLTRGREVMHFCSATCRDEYVSGASGASRAATAHGRTA